MDLGIPQFAIMYHTVINQLRTRSTISTIPTIGILHNHDLPIKNLDKTKSRMMTKRSSSSLLSLVLSSLATVQHVDSFQITKTKMPNNSIHFLPHSRRGSPAHPSISSSPLLLLNAKSRSMPDISDDDNESGVNRIRVKNIEREWTWGNDKDDDGHYIAQGEFSADVFIPEGKIKGCVFFMHGFSQYPIAYRKTLKQTADNANVAIIACETGLTSSIVLKDVASKPLSFITDRTWPQFALQRALSEDTKQCIHMVLDNDQTFREYGIHKKLPLGVCGHSMGGGLCFTVAESFPEINHLFAMAPAIGVDPFQPSDAIEHRAVDNSMLLAGNWDLIAPASKISNLSVQSCEKKANSSILVNVHRGIHTGFEDKLVIFGMPIVNGLGPFAILFNILGFGEFLLLKLLSVFRTSTGQLDGTRALMEYFFEQMANGGKITIEGAEKKVSDSVKEKWEDKFDIKNGE